MSSPITQTTPDPPDMPSIDSLVYTITLQCGNHKQSLAIDDEEPLTADFSHKVHNLQEFFYDRIALLSKNPVAQHHFLWLISLKSLCSFVLKFKEYVYSSVIVDQRQDEGSKIYNSVCGKLTKLCGDFSDLLTLFLNSPDLKLITFIKGSSQVKSSFCTLIVESLELLVASNSSDILDNSILHLEPIQKSLVSYYQLVEKLDNRDDLLGSSFPMLTQFIRIIYMVGEPQLLKPLLSEQIINPQMGGDIVKHSSVDFVDLINFYKFTAFNLVVLSISNQANINRKYNTEANIYLRVLLEFPNLSTSVYDQFVQQASPNEEKPFPDFYSKDRDDDLLVNLLERQEISLNYIINSLLSVNDLRNYIDPGPLFKKELAFLISSLSASLSKEIHRSASRSGSLHSSTFSFSALKEVELQRRRDEQQQRFINRLRLKSFSALLLHGSYKEKLNLIVNVLKEFEKHNLNYTRDLDLPLSFEHDSTLYSVAAPSLGKVLYLTAIKQVSKLLKLLSIKHLVETSGLNHFPKAALAKICAPHSFSEVSAVKNILQYDSHVSNGEKVMVFRRGEERTATTQELVSKQLEIAGLSEQIKTVLAFL